MTISSWCKPCVIASEAKQSRLFSRWFASSLTLLAMTAPAIQSGFVSL
jgi:hypothetical protein